MDISRLYKSMRHVTSAAFLNEPETKTPVFARFSTVAGGAGSVDTPARRARICREVLHPGRQFRPGG